MQLLNTLMKAAGAHAPPPLVADWLARRHHILP